MTPGRIPNPRMRGTITWRVIQPWAEPKDEVERVAKQKALELIEKLKARGDRLRKEREEKRDA
jgi:hypothetical protein